ncbi:MAG: O-antigen ligase family protein [Candidatus Omnitrophica bacterium]|nr:O-antigen ligase family protein [Candidatus Omnitrophota bacterium]
MKKMNLLENKNIFIIWTVVIAFLLGIAMVTSDISSFAAMLLIFALPLLFYLLHKPFVFILKCMLTVIFFIPFEHIKFLNLFNVINPLTILGLILCLKIAGQVIIRKKIEGFNLTVIDKLYFLFVISALISTLSAISVLGALNWIFCSFVTGYIVYKVITTLSAQEIEDILKFLVIAGSLCALYGIFEYLLGKSLVYGEFTGRLTSLIGHPLLNGLIFSTVLPISIFLYFQTKQRRFMYSSIILFIAIIFTLARGSWTSIIAASVIISVFRMNFRTIKIPVILALFLIVIMLIPMTRQMIFNRITANEQSEYSSFNIRTKSIPLALKIAIDKPIFGRGPFNAGRFKKIYSTNSTLGLASYENTYLGLLVDLGFIGITILLLVYCVALKISLFSKPIDTKNYIFKTVAAFSLVILLINMATFNFDSYRIFHFINWFFISLNIVSSKITS